MSITNIVFLVILIGLLSAPTLSFLLKSKRIDPFWPPLMFSGFIFLGYVVPLPQFLRGADRFTLLRDNAIVLSDRALSMTLLIVILAVLGFYAGFSGLGRRGKGYGAKGELNRPVMEGRRGRLIRLGILYTAAGLSIFCIGLALIGGIDVLLSGLGDRLRLFEGLNYFFGALNLLLSFALLWWGYLLAQGQPRVIGFWLYALGSIFLVGLMGSKSTLFVFALAMAIMYHYAYRRITVPKILVGSAFLLVSLTFYALYVREYLAVGEFVTVDPQGALYDEASRAVGDEFGGNFIQLQVLTLLVERVPGELPLQFGKTFLSLFAMPIPRIFWENKPITAPGTLTLAFWPDLWLEQGTTIPPGLIGEVYMNFGVLGIFPCMFGFGRIFSWAQRRLREGNSDARHWTLNALLSAMLLHYIRGEFVAPTVLLTMLGVPIAWGMRYAFRPSLAR